jgi:hypothetical protein
MIRQTDYSHSDPLMLFLAVTLTYVRFMGWGSYALFDTVLTSAGQQILDFRNTIEPHKKFPLHTTSVNHHKIPCSTGIDTSHQSNTSLTRKNALHCCMTYVEGKTCSEIPPHHPAITQHLVVSTTSEPSPAYDQQFAASTLSATAILVTVLGKTKVGVCGE